MDRNNKEQASVLQVSVDLTSNTKWKNVNDISAEWGCKRLAESANGKAARDWQNQPMGRLQEIDRISQWESCKRLTESANGKAARDWQNQPMGRLQEIGKINQWGGCKRRVYTLYELKVKTEDKVCMKITTVYVNYLDGKLYLILRYGINIWWLKHFQHQIKCIYYETTGIYLDCMFCYKDPIVLHLVSQHMKCKKKNLKKYLAICWKCYASVVYSLHRY
jgi:hypothetical protein